jgi:hypothetical protein
MTKLSMSEEEMLKRKYTRPLEKRIADLEKENAELKEIADFQTSSNMDRYFQLKRSKEQLTKAKELIEKLLNAFASNDFFEEEELDAMAEAEQFLNSEVEK